MNVRRLLFREIRYRKANFLLALLAVVAAVGCVVAELTTLQAYNASTKKLLADRLENTTNDLEKERIEAEKRLAGEKNENAKRLATFRANTEKRLANEIAMLKKQRSLDESATKKLLAEFETTTAKRMKKLEDDFRKITKKLGFNILIVPKKQNLIEMQVLGYATEYMPEKYADKLAASKIMTVNHLLPVVQEMVKWKERERRILLTGVRGEVPLAHRDPKKPLIQPVPGKSMVVGYELHRNLKLQKGDKVKFQGRDFTVHVLQPERGNKDDITIWINLQEAQDILGKKGQINLIMALECNCSTIDRIGEIRKDIKKILPDTHVLEFQSKAVARAEARNRAKAEALAMLKQRREETTKTCAQLKKATAAAIKQKQKEAADALDELRIASEIALTQKQRESEDALASEKAKGEREMNSVRESREAVRSKIVGFAMFLVPVALLAAVAWLALMTLNNVHQRRDEIGILRALGLSSASIYALFVGRASIIGMLGGLLGCALGVAVGAFASGAPLGNIVPSIEPLFLAIVILATPLLCAFVGWLAATVASRQDPAVILQDA